MLGSMNACIQIGQTGQREGPGACKIPKASSYLMDFPTWFLPSRRYKAVTFLLSAVEMATKHWAGGVFYRQGLPEVSLHTATSTDDLTDDSVKQQGQGSFGCRHLGNQASDSLTGNSSDLSAAGDGW